MTLAEPTIPAGMKAWHGGDSAPADWDGGSVLLRDGEPTGCKSGEFNVWRWSDDGEGTIIAYTPRTPEPTGDTREQVARIIITGLGLDDCDDDGLSISAGYIVADAILAALPPARDAEVERLREALEPFVRHGRAADAFGDDPDPIRFYTDTGYREVPVADFERARAALSASDGKEGVS